MSVHWQTFPLEQLDHLQQKPGTKHLWVKCFQVCSKERPNCLWRAKNKELIELRNVVYNSYKTQQLTTHIILKMVKVE